jgi:large-conductance mechanosensitive channel
MRIVGSLAFGFLVTFASLALSGSLTFARWLLMPGFVIADSLGFLGVNCLNADSIRAKMYCSWVSLVIDVLIYGVICFLVAMFIKRNTQMRVGGP